MGLLKMKYKMKKIHLIIRQYTRTKSLILILALLLVATATTAQIYTAGDYVNLQLQDFSLIATNNAPINLSMTAGSAGAPLNEATNSDMYVKITSIVPGNTHREITARISNGTVPPGTKLNLISDACTTTNSGGKLGIPSPTPITLNTTDQILIDEIGSCYTGTGYTDGYRLTYTWMTDLNSTTYNQLEATVSPVTLTIVLTITAHNSN